jgi:hypothetical protein
MRGRVHDDEWVTVSTNQQIVPVGDIHVHRIQVAVVSAIQRKATFNLRYSSKRPKQWQKFTAINPFPITTDLQRSFIVSEFTAAHGAVKFFGRPMEFGIGGVGHFFKGVLMGAELS